jgi:predicted transport protein
MQIYQSHGQKLVELIEQPFRLEKEIQTLFERNLYEFTGLEFIKAEFTIKSNRIDTLAFDPESKAFVIIEYKRERNFSVIDQGVSYLNLMLEYKADFIVEYNESQAKNLKRQDVDWSQSRIIFVSPSFTDFQKQSTNFKDLGIELWEIKRYQGDIISINPMQKTKSAPSIKQVQTDNSKEMKTISKEIKQYDEDFHLTGKPDDIKELYEQFRDAILNLAPDLEVNATKLYISIKRHKKTFVCIEIYKKLLRLTLNEKIGKLDDSKKLFRDMSDIGHWGLGDYQVDVSDTKNLEYILSVIKQLFR